MESEILKYLGTIEDPFAEEVSSTYAMLALELANQLSGKPIQAQDPEAPSSRILDYVHSHHFPDESKKELGDLVQDQNQNLNGLTYIALMEATSVIAGIEDPYTEVGDIVLHRGFKYINTARRLFSIEAVYKLSNLFAKGFSTLIDMQTTPVHVIKALVLPRTNVKITKATLPYYVKRLKDKFIMGISESEEKFSDEEIRKKAFHLTELVLDNDDRLTKRFLRAVPTVYLNSRGEPKKPAEFLDHQKVYSPEENLEKRVYVVQFEPTRIKERIRAKTNSKKRQRDLEVEVAQQRYVLRMYKEEEVRKRKEAERELKEKERRLEAARQVFKSHLPKIRDTDKFNFGWFYESAHELGGDIYDVIPIDKENTALYIADVSGHDLSQVLLTLPLHSHVKSMDNETKKHPGRVLSNLHEHLSEILMENASFITMAYFVIDNNGNVTYCNAGHPFYRVFNFANGKILDNQQLGGSSAAVIGFPFLDDDIDYNKNERTFQIEPQDTLLIYTDGFWEGINPDGEQFGEERIINSFRSNCKTTINEKIEDVFTDLKKFTGKTEFEDDLTILGVQRIN
ncbi:MAG: SpoIIE family protein phosphatase [Nanoarchaeota archaeon]